MNGVNVCELVSVPNMVVFNTCFNFWTIDQLGGQTPLSPSDSVELICCMNFTEFVIKSHSERSCVICILWFIYCIEMNYIITVAFVI